MRLIDADAANVDNISCYYGSSCYAEDVEEWLNELPATDVVKVVRCKDCEYYEMDECGNPYIWMSDGAHLYTQPDDFCSYGERKDGDKE